MFYFVIVAALITGTARGEYFKSASARSEDLQLSNQWQYLSKFSYTGAGVVDASIFYVPPTTGTVKLLLYQVKVENWQLVLDTNTCVGREERRTQEFELGLEEIEEIQDQRACYRYYSGIVCDVRIPVNGNDEKGPWGFLALSFCGRNINELQVQWLVHSTNAKGYLTKEAPLHDYGIFLTYLILLIILILLGIFWIAYKYEPKVNKIKFITPYRISLVGSIIAFILIVAHFGQLNRSGTRNVGIFNAGFIVLLVSAAIYIQGALVLIWSGSTTKVHLTRIKTVFSYVLPILFVIAIVAVAAMHVLFYEQYNYYLFEGLNNRYLIWVVLGGGFILFIIMTISMVTSKKDETAPYLWGLYAVLSLYLLGVPIFGLIGLTNLASARKKLFFYAWLAVLHTLLYLYLLYCIKDNHTLKSIGHWLYKMGFKFCCCNMVCCRDKDGNASCCGCLRGKKHKSKSKSDRYGSAGGAGGGDGGRHGNRERYGPLGACCPLCCLPCMGKCCPCCMKKDKVNGYHSETDLQKILVFPSDEREEDLTIVEVDGAYPGRKKGHEEELVIHINKLARTDESISPEMEDPVKTQVNNKVLPWLYSDLNNQPQPKPSPRSQWIKAVTHKDFGPNSNKDYFKRAAMFNHWTQGNFKPFATDGSRVLPSTAETTVLSQSLSSQPLSVYESSGYPKSMSYQDSVKSRGMYGNLSRNTNPLKSPSLTRNTQVANGDDSSVSEGGDRFDVTEYNSSKLRKEKAKVVTMRYRRNTLKSNLSNVPTSVLLDRLASVEDKDSGVEMATPTKFKVAHSINKPAPKIERSKSTLWKMLAKKYTNGKPEVKTDEERIRSTLRAFSIHRGLKRV